MRVIQHSWKFVLIRCRARRKLRELRSSEYIYRRSKNEDKMRDILTGLFINVNKMVNESTGESLELTEPTDVPAMFAPRGEKTHTFRNPARGVARLGVLFEADRVMVGIASQADFSV